MPIIQVGTQQINFPNTGRDAIWSGTVIQFAEAVSQILLSLSAPNDIPPRVQTLSSDINTLLPLDGCSFANTGVRGFLFQYNIYRTNGVIIITESGTVEAVQNGGVWTLQHEFTGQSQPNGFPYHSFEMQADQLVLNTTALTGAYDINNSTISFYAKTQLVSN